MSDGNCTVTADQNADVHNAYGACRNPQTSIDCGQGVTVTTDVDLDPVDSIVDMAEVGVQTDSVPTRVVWGGGDSQVTMEDLKEPLVCPLAGLGYTGLELAATLGKQSVFAYLDSGSTGNYISEKLAHQLGLVLTRRTCVAGNGRQNNTLYIGKNYKSANALWFCRDQIFS